MPGTQLTSSSSAPQATALLDHQPQDVPADAATLVVAVDHQPPQVRPGCVAVGAASITKPDQVAVGLDGPEPRDERAAGVVDARGRRLRQ